MFTRDTDAVMAATEEPARNMLGIMNWPAPEYQKDGQKLPPARDSADGVPQNAAGKANGHIAQHDGNGGGERRKYVLARKHDAYDNRLADF